MACGPVGKFIRKKRTALRLTQKQLSSALGFKTPQFISNIERGVAHIPSSRIKDFADVLNVKLGDLAFLVSEALKSRLHSGDPFIDKFLCAWADASDTDRELIKSLVSRVLRIEE